VAAIAAVYRETGWRWTAFAGAWTTGLAYAASVLFYQAATIGRHPVSSLFWIVRTVRRLPRRRHDHAADERQGKKSDPGLPDGEKA
jgi:hypothetical protein